MENQNQTSPISSSDTDAHRQRMARRKEIQDKRMAETTAEKGLVIVHTGPGKGKTTAALGMVLRSLGHGYRVAIVQFIKGAWEPAEKNAFAHWGDQLAFHAMGEGFSWVTQDRARDTTSAQKAWAAALGYVANPDYRLVLLDEINVALRHGYLTVDQVLDGLARKPALTHVILTGRGAPAALIDRADLVTEMTLVKHPLKDQRIRAQPGIEY
ncbi:cob(I)yrinic acid a,c-diamide adenosyltransferase [Termitidicoccus mucosus]|uniref:corrinoid adenosyltransferase n=1 Tax=Termitidicoccus mucosus TaxID=1184151 RepID=A0A178IIB3_9BACT|nr:cob(I)yrinic acid a,c-diamide adenosyltransferase [Opitutaceae bacterium TSB47]